MVALLFHLGSLSGVLKDGGVPWSKLSSARRIPFVLMRDHHGSIEPQIYSVADGVTYPYQWSRQPGSMDKEAGAALGRLAALAQGMYATQINEWACERCSSRINCPHWLEAIVETAAPA